MNMKPAADRTDHPRPARARRARVRGRTPGPGVLLPEDNAREGFIDPPEFAVLLAELTARGAPDVADAAEFAY